MNTAPVTQSNTPENYSQVSKYRYQRVVKKVITHLALLFISAASLVPLLYMVSTSLKERGREFSHPIEWIPDPIMWENYKTALEVVPAMSSLPTRSSLPRSLWSVGY